MAFAIRDFGGTARFAGVQSLLTVALLLGSPQHSAAQQQKMLRVGVIASTSNSVAANSFRGFEDAMAGAGFKEGVNVTYDREDSEGNPEKVRSIAQKFADGKVDLIHSFGTSATLAVMKATTIEPIVFAAVGDPVASGIVPAGSSVGKPSGTRVTGVSDLWPVALQMETYAKVYPKAKKWGAIYNPADANFQYNITSLRRAARKLGLELFEVPVDSSDKVRSAMDSLVGKVHAIYIPSGRTVVADINAVSEVAARNGIAFFSGTPSSISQGALAAFGVNYYLVGYAAGKKASLVLKGIDPATIPLSRGGNFSLIVNQKVAKALGIVIPAEALRIADNVVE